jgi:hypothetical protein
MADVAPLFERFRAAIIPIEVAFGAAAAQPVVNSRPTGAAASAIRTRRTLDRRRQPPHRITVPPSSVSVYDFEVK